MKSRKESRNLKSTSDYHTPVLLQETLQYLNVKPGHNYLDATVGGGGHTTAILNKGGRVLGIDQDPEAVAYSKKHLSLNYNSNSYLIKQSNFAELKQAVEEASQQMDAKAFDGILFDLGVSSHQLESKNRGFSFNKDAALDMRMNPQQGRSAQEIINNLNKEDLYEIFAKFGGEELSLPIAEAIVREREKQPIKTTSELAELIEKVYKQEHRRRGRLHPATKVFQALRIYVNKELENLKKALPQAVEVLKKEGRLVVISFHEGEDRIVKQFFRNEKELKELTKKPVRADRKEIIINNRARSAKLRAAEKI